MVSIFCAQLSYGRDIVQMKSDQHEERPGGQAGMENKEKELHDQFNFLLPWNWDLCTLFSFLLEPSQLHLRSLWIGVNSYWATTSQTEILGCWQLLKAEFLTLNFYVEANMSHEQQQPTVIGWEGRGWE